MSSRASSLWPWRRPPELQRQRRPAASASALGELSADNRLPQTSGNTPVTDWDDASTLVDGGEEDVEEAAFWHRLAIGYVATNVDPLTGFSPYTMSMPSLSAPAVSTPDVSTAGSMGLTGGPRMRSPPSSVASLAPEASVAQDENEPPDTPVAMSQNPNGQIRNSDRRGPTTFPSTSRPQCARCSLFQGLCDCSQEGDEWEIPTRHFSRNRIRLATFTRELRRVFNRRPLRRQGPSRPQGSGRLGELSENDPELAESRTNPQSSVSFDARSFRSL